MILLVFAVALSVITALFVALPILLEAKSTDNQDIAPSISHELLDAKEHVLRSIKDLDLDFAMGKVSQEDYNDSKEKLSFEASTIIEKLTRSKTDLPKNI